MANAVLVQTHVVAMDVDAYNRQAVSAVNTPNGTAVTLANPSTTGKQGEVFVATKVADNTTKDVWMAYSPEVNTIVAGNAQYRGIDVDPRNYTNIAGVPYDVFKPVAGVDLIQVTKDWFKATKDPDTVTGATVVEMDSDGDFVAKVSSTSAYAGVGFKIVKKDPIIIASGTLGGEQIDAWILECTAN